ncbi:MAG: hypothetical protein AAF696_33605, partial [Bacteroidota bacterium]
LFYHTKFIFDETPWKCEDVELLIEQLNSINPIKLKLANEEILTCIIDLANQALELDQDIYIIAV